MLKKRKESNTMKNTIKVEKLLEKLDKVKTRYSYPSVVDSMLDEVIEIVEKMSKTFSVGDTITIPLEGLGEFTATAQRVTDKGIIFMFDECISIMPMNYENFNTGGYDSSYLCHWINTVLKDAFPDNIRNRITEISIPSYGQIFGHDELYEENIEPDNDDQFELMKIRKNRIADFKNKCSGYWIRNIYLFIFEPDIAVFTNVEDDGLASCRFASSPSGVRPVFALSV